MQGNFFCKHNKNKRWSLYRTVVGMPFFWVLWLLFNCPEALATGEECHPTSPTGQPPTLYTETYSVTATELSKQYAVTFKCTDDAPSNLSNADIDVELEVITAPTAGPSNLDLGSPGVTHTVTVGTNSSSSSDLANGVTATSNNTTVVASTTGETGENLALTNGEITIYVTSTFSLQGGAEEFAAGVYDAQFRITATPTVGATSGANLTVIDNTTTASCTTTTVTPVTDTYSGSSTSITASGSIAYDCNSTLVDVDVVMKTFSSPATAPSGLPVNHTVDFTSNPSTTFTSYTQTPQANVTAGTASIITKQDAGTDANGDIGVTLTSTISTTGSSLPGGDYRSEYEVTITAQ